MQSRLLLLGDTFLFTIFFSYFPKWGVWILVRVLVFLEDHTQHLQGLLQAQFWGVPDHGNRRTQASLRTMRTSPRRGSAPQNGLFLKQGFAFLGRCSFLPLSASKPQIASVLVLFKYLGGPESRGQLWRLQGAPGGCLGKESTQWAPLIGIGVEKTE